MDYSLLITLIIALLTGAISFFVMPKIPSKDMIFNSSKTIVTTMVYRTALFVFIIGAASALYGYFLVSQHNITNDFILEFLFIFFMIRSIKNLLYTRNIKRVWVIIDNIFQIIISTSLFFIIPSKTVLLIVYYILLMVINTIFIIVFSLNKKYITEFDISLRKPATIKYYFEISYILVAVYTFILTIAISDSSLNYAIVLTNNERLIYYTIILLFIFSALINVITIYATSNYIQKNSFCLKNTSSNKLYLIKHISDIGVLTLKQMDDNVDYPDTFVNIEKIDKYEVKENIKFDYRFTPSIYENIEEKEVKKMNKPSEQLTKNLELVKDIDQPLKRAELDNTLRSVLGSDNCTYDSSSGHKVFVYSNEGESIVILSKAVTYLGNPHPVFKKRIQLPDTWKDIYLYYKSKPKYSVRFIGIYHYEGNILFVDFEKNTYVSKKMHNSAAHVYINDLYQGAIQSTFSKIDKNGNTVTTIAYNSFKTYLDTSKINQNALINPFDNFNSVFDYDNWILASNAITEMQANNWVNWRQAEWPGWYLEFKFDSFLKNNNLESTIKYIGSNSSQLNLLDLDLLFENGKFYGDLKASDETKIVAPGNDQTTFIDAINQCNRFWYVIYEHKTNKDKNNNFEATIFRNEFIESIDGIERDKMSYSSRMKHSVLFSKMMIIELNQINYGEVLSTLNQGHQPNGGKRNPKFKINKRNIDNFVIYRYIH